MLTIQISPYQPEFQQPIIDLILPIQQQEFGSVITLDDQPDLLTIPSVYQRGCGNFWVALHQGQVVGTIAAIDIGHHQLTLRKMFVAAPYRGKHLGVGQRLLETLLGWSIDHGIQEIYLGTIDAFKAAHRFYEKNGFIQITDADLPVAFPKVLGDKIFYRLGLMQSARC